MIKSYSLTCLFWIIFSITLSAQTPIITDGLIAYYSFDNCDAFDDTENGSDGIIVGTPNCVCGVSGNALEFDGINDHILFLGLVNNYFNTDNFSVSFYFKAFGSPLTQDILSKRENCGPDNAFSVDYRPNLGTISADLSEDFDKQSSSNGRLDFNNCWQHAVIVRKAGRTRLYLNGIEAAIGTAISRVDIENNAVLALADSPCVGSTVNRFKGYIDELTVYSRDLLEDEVQLLYLSPDKIGNSDTLIYLGQSMEATVSNTCVTEFSWTPIDGVDDPTIENPIITPTQTTTYTVEMIDDNGCRARDSVLVTVLDPSTLSCDDIFVPKAFTPNGIGPSSNETVGISNPYALDELVSFEIFDRWGGKVFMTENAFDQWDGKMSGKDLNPGVFLYKMEYKCSGANKTKFGSITLIR